MNPQWDTPPNGDFARYIEQLSARSALALRTSEANGEHALDVGIAASADAHDEVAAGRAAVRQRLARRLAGAANGSASEGVSGPGSVGSGSGGLVRGIAAVWLFVLVAMLVLDASFGLFLLVAGIGVGLANRMRRHILPPGVNGWREWFEDIARKAAEKQSRQQSR